VAESLPPLTTDELLTALDNPHFISYLYFGAANDAGWKVAIGAQRFSPGLRSYRIAAEKQAEVKRALKINGNPKGALLDFGRSVVSKLNKAQAEDPLYVLDEVAKA
jgi:hypothetical protein